MTIEQLLELPPEGLEALTDEQLTQCLSCYFPATRPPEPIQSRIITSTKQNSAPKRTAKKEQLAELLAKLTVIQQTPEELAAKAAKVSAMRQALAKK